MLACQRAGTVASVPASHITCNATSEKWQEYSNYSAYFVLLNCFSLANNILVQILGSSVHSNNKTILCVLCASLPYKEQAIRVPLMMENHFCYKQYSRTNFKNDGKVQMTSSSEKSEHHISKRLLAKPFLRQILH